MRDNIHSADLVRAFDAFHRAPRAGRRLQPRRRAREQLSRCSRRSTLCQQIAGRELDWSSPTRRAIGDHRWWISDLSEFRRDYPEFRLTYGIETVLREILAANVEHWSPAAA